jgi:hypothetical protein
LPHLQIQPADVKIDTWQPSAQHLTDYYFIWSLTQTTIVRVDTIAATPDPDGRCKDWHVAI